LDLATILASEKVYKDIVSSAYPCSVGKALSQEDRDESNRTSEANLTYGEIPFRSMAFILEKIRQEYGKPRPAAGNHEEEEEEEEERGIMQEPGKDVIYDIGSGTGKPCFAAAAIFPFRKVVGIEVLGKLHEAAQEIQKKWAVEAVPALAAARRGGKEGGQQGETTMATQLEFLQGDFRDLSLCDWPSQADVCVANSTCFSNELMVDLAGLAAGMGKGSVFVTLTKRLPSPEHWEVMDDTLMMMSWGGATVYTQRKKTPPCPRDKVK
jgi:SAM-dependent methyltransferase